MQRLQSQLIERFIKVRNARAMQRIVQPVPGIFSARAQLTPVEKDVILVSLQMNGKAALMQIRRATQILKPVADIAKREKDIVAGRQIEPILQRPLP